MGSTTLPAIPTSSTIWRCHEPSAPITAIHSEGMLRFLLLLHRYLGVAVGALMVMWCLSGVVMMYVSYPALAEGDRLRHLQPIAWDGCCTIANALLANAGEFQVEMLAGRPVLLAVNGSMRR